MGGEADPQGTLQEAKVYPYWQMVSAGVKKQNKPKC